MAAPSSIPNSRGQREISAPSRMSLTLVMFPTRAKDKIAKSLSYPLQAKILFRKRWPKCRRPTEFQIWFSSDRDAREITQTDLNSGSSRFNTSITRPADSRRPFPQEAINDQTQLDEFRFTRCPSNSARASRRAFARRGSAQNWRLAADKNSDSSKTRTGLSAYEVFYHEADDRLLIHARNAKHNRNIRAAPKMLHR